jgi:dTDP-4-dehydrorhamnose 3,5-epimerase
MPFIFHETKLPGVLRIEPRCFGDSRGFFRETYKKSAFQEAGIMEDFVQDNHSFSTVGVLRGVHFQNSPFSQGKLVGVITGSVWDVAVDLRPTSSAYGEWQGFYINDKNRELLYLPPGFGHGFLVLEANTNFMYKCTEEYSPEYDAGIRWDDPDIGVQWPLGTLSPVISEKDLHLPYLRDL